MGMFVHDDVDEFYDYDDEENVDIDPFSTCSNCGLGTIEQIDDEYWCSFCGKYHGRAR